MLLALAGAALTFGQTLPRAEVETPVLPQYYIPATHGPTLSRLVMQVTATGNGTITLPAPSSYGGQKLVSLHVECDPPSSLERWSMRVVDHGLNSRIMAVLRSGKSSARLSYIALVVCPGDEAHREETKEYLPWLLSSKCVPATDKRVLDAGMGLADAHASNEQAAGRIAMWVARLQPGIADKPLGGSAIDVLTNGGAACARANLCAALLRARRIPARPVACMPTWASGPFPEHCMTEYRTEEGEWVMVDPSVGVLHPAHNSAVILAITTPDTENRPSRGTPWSPAGTPSMAMPEPSRGVIAVATQLPQTSITLMKTFPGQMVGRILSAANRRFLKVFASARKGRSDALEAQAVSAALSHGPSAFALFLDGQKQR